MAPQTTDAPFLDAAELFGAGHTIPQFTTAPFLDSGAGFAPGIVQGTPATGLVLKVGGSTLSGAFDRSWLDELAGPGQFSFQMLRDDWLSGDGYVDVYEDVYSNEPLFGFGDIVSFVEDGVVRFAGPVEIPNVVDRAAGGAADEVATLRGRGRLAVTDKAPIGPSRGWDAEPVEVTRSQSWVSVDFDDSGWLHAKRIRRVDTPGPHAPHTTSPEWYPDKTAWKVAPNRADITGTSAPVGGSLYRSDPITLAAGTIEVVFGLNNKGEVFFNGASLGDVANSPVDGNRVRRDVSAGSDHVLAAQVTNFIRDTWFVASIYSVDSDGLLDDLLWSSDSDNMRALPYPSSTPGLTPGKAVRLLVEELQADGFLADLVLDFTDLLDTDGEPWATVTEITVEVGRYLLEYLEALSDWAVDVQMAPGSNTLRMWNWGTRGGTPDVTIVATTDRDTSEVEALSWAGIQVRGNQARVRFRGGYTFVDLSGDDDPVCVFIDLSEVRSETTAQVMATELLELRKEPSWAGSLTLAPASSSPYEDFDNGDLVAHPANPSGGLSSRVRSISREENENGNPSWTLELHDVRQQVEERQENWLRRTAMGNLHGGARVTSKSGDPIPPATKVSTKDAAVFSFQDPVDGTISGKDPAKSSGNLIEFYVEVTTDDGTAPAGQTQVKVYKNGVSLGTLTIPAGESDGEFDLGAEKTYRNVDRYRAEVVDVGSDVVGISVQVRAI